MKTLRVLIPIALPGLLALACNAPMTQKNRTQAPKIWENEPYANANGTGG